MNALVKHEQAFGIAPARLNVPVNPLPISLRGLTKRYGSITALKNLDLNVYPGEVFGFLGLNGAGKTTAIRLILDLLRPSAGTASVFGFDCWRQSLEARRHIGYLPGELGLYGDMTGSQTLEFLARLGGGTVDRDYRKELCERLELVELDLRRPVREYSTGMKRKLGIIQALQAKPPLLILDEPTEGLDPLMQESFFSLVADVRAKGATVFMSSHVLSEVERICDRIGLLRQGELVLLKSVEEIRGLAPRRVTVVFDRDVEALPDMPCDCVLIERSSRQVRLSASGPLGRLLEALRSLPVQDLQVQEPRLEDVVISFYREPPP